MKLKYCRICHNESFTSILDLGEIYPSNFVESQDDLQKYPLHLIKCNSCHLVQLADTVDLDLMYRQYWYKSSLNPSMVRDLTNVRDSILQRRPLEKNDVILDIGCNDGTLLRLFEEVSNEIYTIGFDPAYNLLEEAQQNCTLFINDYFSANEIEGWYPDIITSIAMFYDLPDPNKFVQDIKKILHINGIWVVQFQDLMSMLKSNAFDNICHEHLEYYTLADIYSLMERHGLSVFDVEYNKVNGGSLRVYICHSHSSKYQLTSRVTYRLADEFAYFNIVDRFSQFKNSVERVKSDLQEFITREVIVNKKKIYVLGASTKGNTLLQYCGLDENYIKYALEVNPDKWGKRTVGTNIPIVNEELLRKANVDYLLVLPWHFNDFFNKKFTWYLNQGGKLVYPLPSLTIIGE